MKVSCARQFRKRAVAALVAAIFFFSFVPCETASAVTRVESGASDDAAAGKEVASHVETGVDEELSGEANHEFPAVSDEQPDPDKGDETAAPESKTAAKAASSPEDLTKLSMAALGKRIGLLAADYPYFFHIATAPDPFGSGHRFRQYYVPAGSDVPQLSFCLEMGKNAPPDSKRVAYTPMGAPAWATALATYAPAILSAHGIDVVSDNPQRYWAMQDAVWALTGSGIGAAANAPVVQALINAAQGSVEASNPQFGGISNGSVLQAKVYNEDTVRYGPFSISGMNGNASMKISGAPKSVFLGTDSREKISLDSVPGDTNLYVYMPRGLNVVGQISIEISAAYTIPSTMDAFQSPDASYQNQLVMSNWTPNSGIITISARLGGFGEYEITKLDAGWRPDFREVDYDDNGQGDVYRLAGAVFKLQQWNGDAYADMNRIAKYDPQKRVYRTGFLAETAGNGGKFRIVEAKAPYGYRDPIMIDFSVKNHYDLVLDDQGGDVFEELNESVRDENSDDDGTFFVTNNLLNVKIELSKRDNAESGVAFSDAAAPQGEAVLGGAYYGLFYEDAVGDPSGIKRDAGELVCIGITGEDGRLVFDSSDAARKESERALIWSNSDNHTNYGTEDFPVYLPVFERQDRRIYPAKYYVQELVPSCGYLLDIDPDTADLDANGVPIPGTGEARKYFIDARDDGKASNPAGIRIAKIVREQVKMRGFLLRKIRSDGNETEYKNLNGAGLSVYFVNDLVDIMKKASVADASVNVPVRGPSGWNKQDFIDFFYDSDYEHPAGEGDSGKDWYNREGAPHKGRYDFDRYPELKRARIDYKETPIFYSGAGPLPGFRYGEYGRTAKPRAGEVIFPEFPYGEYIVFETEVPAGTDRIKPFVVSIMEDGGDVIDGDGMFDAARPEQDWRVQSDSDKFSIRLWKKDAETGRVVIKKDAAFRIKYLGADGTEGGTDDQWVEMAVPEQNGIVRYGTEDNPFRLGTDGVLILPKKLRSGAYKLYEVEAPSGYVLAYHEASGESGFYEADEALVHKHGYGNDYKEGDENYVEGHYIIYNPVSGSHDPQPDVGIVFDTDEAHRVADFDIDEDSYDDFVIDVVQFNERQKGQLNIYKEREDETGGHVPFPGVRFELYAEEDILSPDGHGVVLFGKGALVASAVTDEKGRAWFADLYLGLYILKEVDVDDAFKITIDGKKSPAYKFADPIRIDMRPPAGSGLDADSPFYQEHPVISASWDILNVPLLQISAEVDKDTIKRTSAAFVSLPGQAGYMNVGAGNERYRYDVDFRSISKYWADEFVVDDPLENADVGKIVVEELWTPVVWGDYDGLWNLWYATNLMDSGKDYSDVSAMSGNPENPENPDRTACYPNTGLRLLAGGLKTNERYHFTLADFGLEKGERLTHLRYEYGRVEVGFTSKNYSDKSLNGEHRKISGKDLELPSKAAGELALLDPVSLGLLFPQASESYITGIKGDIVDWTPIKGTCFYAEGAANPGYELKPAAYLVSAAKPMREADIVSSVSARIARNVTFRGYDQDAVVTKLIDTFEYKGSVTKGKGGGVYASAPRTFDEYPLLFWLVLLLCAFITLLALGRYSIKKRCMARSANR